MGSRLEQVREFILEQLKGDCVERDSLRSKYVEKFGDSPTAKTEFNVALKQLARDGHIVMLGREVICAKQPPIPPEWIDMMYTLTKELKEREEAERNGRVLMYFVKSDDLVSLVEYLKNCKDPVKVYVEDPVDLTLLLMTLDKAILSDEEKELLKILALKTPREYAFDMFRRVFIRFTCATSTKVEVYTTRDTALVYLAAAQQILPKNTKNNTEKHTEDDVTSDSFDDPLFERIMTEDDYLEVLSLLDLRERRLCKWTFYKTYKQYIEPKFSNPITRLAALLRRCSVSDPLWPFIRFVRVVPDEMRKQHSRQR